MTGVLLFCPIAMNLPPLCQVRVACPGRGEPMQLPMAGRLRTTLLVASLRINDNPRHLPDAGCGRDAFSPSSLPLAEQSQYHYTRRHESGGRDPAYALRFFEHKDAE